MPKNDFFVDELTDGRKQGVVSCWRNVADAFHYRSVRFERLPDGTLDASTNITGHGDPTPELLADAIAHAKDVRADLAAQIPELRWTDADPVTRFGVVDDYGEACVGVAVEVEGKILSWSEWCALQGDAAS